MAATSTLIDAYAIRRATPADAETLARLGRACNHETWIEDYRMPYAPAAFAAFLDRIFDVPALEAALADHAQAFWLLEHDGQPIGYARAGPCTLPYPDVPPEDGELRWLYVRRPHQGGGTGGRLLDTALAWLERDGPRRIWLGVWSGNLAGQRFYARRGFRIVGDHSFVVGETVDHEHAMRRG